MGSETDSLLSSHEGSTYGTARLSRRSIIQEQASQIKKVPLRALFRFATKRDKWIIGIGAIFSLIHGAGFPVLALYFGEMTNLLLKESIFDFLNNTVTKNSGQIYNNAIPGDFNREEFSGNMTTYSIIFASLGVVVLIASFMQVLCWELACERQVYRLRQEFFYQVLRQDISWFDNRNSGSLATKLSDEIERVREGIGHKFSMVVKQIAAFISGLCIGFYVSWQLTLVLLALTPLLAAASAFSAKLIATQSIREQQKYGKAGMVAQEVISSIRTIASFSGEKREISRYETALMTGLQVAIHKYHVFAIIIGLMFFIMYGTYALTFWYGAYLIENDGLLPGNLFTVFFSVMVGALSLGNAVPFASIIGAAKGAGATLFEVIDSMPLIDSYSKTGLLPEKVTGEIRFCNVHFTYPSRRAVPILKNFNLKITEGKTVAIVGQSGEGKSTVVQLLLRFYDPDSGAVLIDGNDVKALNLAWLRYHIGYVSQEPTLFGVTIYENIRFGREEATSSEIIAAAKMAYAHEFISALPHGYETMVGERGSQLSGGQKQRIAIARALVRDPKILLLDEATSALDAKSEEEVQIALDRARKGRTTIIIAHRLSTVKDADMIYVVKNGEIAEMGNHNQLISKEGLYYELITAQTSMESERDEFSAASAQESAEDSYSDYDIFFKVTKRKSRKARNRLRKTTRLPDLHKSELMDEVGELKLKSPSLWKILKVNRAEWVLLLLGAIGCIFTGAIVPIFAYMYSEMFSVLLKAGENLQEETLFWSLMIVALAVFSFFAFWMRTIFIASAGEYLTFRLRLNSFSGIVRQSIGWFEKETNGTSKLVTRLARDAPLVKAAAGHRLGVVLSAVVTLVLGLGTAFYFSWRLALVISVSIPLLVIAGYFQINIQRTGNKRDTLALQEAGKLANEAVSNIRTVQSLGQQRIFFDQYLDNLFLSYEESHKQALVFAIAYAFSEAVIFFIYSASFKYGSVLIEEHYISAVTLFRVFFSIAFCATSVGQTISYIPDYTKASLASALIFNLVDLKSDIDPCSKGGLTPEFTGEIAFKDVHFRYASRPETAVLQGLSFEVKKGQTVALVGHSGCGKSTIVSLLLRFYDVTSGHVTIDGYDVRSLNVQHLRKNIGVVRQEPVIFDCSIRDNIAYGYNCGDVISCPNDLVIKAAKSANIHNFVISLPNGYETTVGERGAQLSAGQKQRIGIARALIRDPKVLLLDEATSALDTENEKLVQDALEKARAGRTCIIIAHRLSTIQNADFIGVISRGRIAEFGTHTQLKGKKGLYFKLTKNQQIITH